MANMKAVLDEHIWPLLRPQPPAAAGTDTAPLAQPRAVPLRYILVQAVLLWLASRLIVFCATYCELLLSVRSGAAPIILNPRSWFHLWQQHDVTWYLNIAATGYPPDPTRAAFFPLFPALVHIVMPLVHGVPHILVAAMLVSNLGALAAFTGLGLLAAHENAASTAPVAMRMMAAYPFAFFMIAGYADGLFVALCVFALFFARRQSWYWAALCGFLAGLTRPTAVILVVPLFWEYGRRKGVWQALWARDWRTLITAFRLRTLGDWALVTLSVPAAIGLYALYLGRTFGHPFLFLELQSSAWHRHTLAPAQLVALAAATWSHTLPWSTDQVRMLLDLVPVVVFAALTIPLARKLPVLYTLYMLGVLVTSVSSPIVDYVFPFDGAGRYLLPSIPIFLLLGIWAQRRPWLDSLATGGGFALQAILATYFILGGALI